MSSAPADALARVTVAASGHARLAWADGLTVSLPKAWLDAAHLTERIDSGSRLLVPSEPPRLPADAPARLRFRAAFTPDPPPSSRLPFSYRAVPTVLRQAIAHAIGRRQRRRAHEWAAFPQWPLDLSADVLDDLVGVSAAPRRPTPVLLTHDIDSAEGLDALVRTFLPIEEAHAARSTSFVVPCAWTLDMALLEEAAARGHVLGIHGYDHSNRTAFADATERRRRLDAPHALVERFGITGYRAPSLLRTRELIDDLAPRYRFDSSIPTSGGLFPVPNNGCATARPFRIGELVEIPISMPRDGSLLFLGYAPADILALWKHCADLVARSGGVVVLLTHCERHFSGGTEMLRAYRAFLDWLTTDGRFTWATPADVLDAPRR